MPRTEINTDQIGDEQVQRQDLNVSQSSKAVIARIIAGTNISISSTGADTGTGDVTINATGGSDENVAVKTSDYTAITTDQTILVDASSNDVTISLYTAVGNTGKKLRIKAKDVTNTITIDPFGTQTINEETTIELPTKGDSITIISDGANWQVI